VTSSYFRERALSDVTRHPRGDAASLLFGFDSEGKITGIGVEGMAGD